MKVIYVCLILMSFNTWAKSEVENGDKVVDNMRDMLGACLLGCGYGSALGGSGVPGSSKMCMDHCQQMFGSGRIANLCPNLVQKARSECFFKAGAKSAGRSQTAELMPKDGDAPTVSH